jgi:hypothetical protein
MASLARKSFDDNSKDIKRLLDVWNALQRLAKRVPQKSDGTEIPATRIVFLKSIIVLLISYWEAYLEDIAGEALKHIIQNVKDSNELPKELKKAITKELEKEKDELAVWKLCGDNWRMLCLDRFQVLTEQRNRNFNSPKSYLTNEFIQKSIGLENITKKWKTDTLDSEQCNKKLDDLIELRGAIAHRGKVTRTLTMDSVTADIEFIKKLVASTGGAINSFVKKITHISLW